MGFFFHHLRGETKKVIIRLPLGSFRRFQLKSMNYSGYEYLCKDLKAYIINTENITSISRVNEVVTFTNGEQLEMGKRSIDKLKKFIQEKIRNESF